MKDLTQTNFRLCFNTEAGRAALGRILIDAGYFDADLKTTEQLAVLNFAKGILKKCGVHDAKFPAQVGTYIDKLFEIPVRTE